MGLMSNKPELDGVARAGLAAKGNIVGIGNRLGADKTLLEIGVEICSSFVAAAAARHVRRRVKLGYERRVGACFSRHFGPGPRM
jgi:hypothetical protein